MFAAAAGFPDDAVGSIPGLAIGADAHLVVLVVDSTARACLGAFAEVAIPSEVHFAQAAFRGFVPLLAVDAEQAVAAIPVVAVLAGACHSIPDLAADAGGGFTVAIPHDAAIRAHAQVGVAVEVGAASAQSLLEADCAIPVGSSWALAGEGVDVPFLAANAGVHFHAGVAVPPGGSRALAHFGPGVEDAAEGAVEADGASPAGANGALALVVENVEGLPSGAQLDAATAVPVEAVATAHAAFLDGGVGAGRAGIDADSVADELVAGATGALGADEEDVLEGEVLHQPLAEAQIEDELGA